eukprot:GHVS01031514.1.p2 GENE.GHVS01031514.1~~GHVS01031514.1.p2  ORF type:complete len:110 (-),score=10.75 GHVS01031514.1:381-710(-)
MTTVITISTINTSIIITDCVNPVRCHKSITVTTIIITTTINRPIVHNRSLCDQELDRVVSIGTVMSKTRNRSRLLDNRTKVVPRPQHRLHECSSLPMALTLTENHESLH